MTEPTTPQPYSTPQVTLTMTRLVAAIQAVLAWHPGIVLQPNIWSLMFGSDWSLAYPEELVVHPVYCILLLQPAGCCVPRLRHVYDDAQSAIATLLGCTEANVEQIRDGFDLATVTDDNAGPWLSLGADLRKKFAAETVLNAEDSATLTGCEIRLRMNPARRDVPTQHTLPISIGKSSKITLVDLGRDRLLYGNVQLEAVRYLTLHPHTTLGLAEGDKILFYLLSAGGYIRALPWRGPCERLRKQLEEVWSGPGDMFYGGVQKILRKMAGGAHALQA